MRRIYTVGQVNRYIKGLFTGDGLLSAILVRGEVSNCKYHSSGHIYFSIKDETGTLSCIMFAGNRRGLAFRMKDGDKVVVGGTVDVYERDGRYQLYAREIQLEGEGLLYERFMRLKKELEEQGLFDPMYKKPIPRYASRVGIVTAPTGAAIRDIESISARRNPYVQLILCPALVQGDGAKESIVRGIRALDGKVDVIIVGRGGGSYEDLFAFNEEEVARAIFECGTPIISAVGHETDTTIADFAADMRAPTPSAAAELAVFDFAKYIHDLTTASRRLTGGLAHRLEIVRSREQYLSARFAGNAPVVKIRDARRHAADLESIFEEAVVSSIEDARERAAVLQDSMTGTLTEALQNAGERADELGERMTDSLRETVRDRRTKLQVLAAAFDGKSPLKRLMQGYSYVQDASGKAVTSVGAVSQGDTLTIHVTDGVIGAEVTEKKKAALQSGPADS